jgi:TRAP-type C4-dicarboxylate transport system substrate-binding protein
MTRSVLLCITALAVVGCGGSGDEGSNKAGAPVTPKSRELTLQATDAGGAEAEYLARRIEERSEGSLSVRLVADYDSKFPANEVKLARALRAERVDFGLLPARAWETAGLKAFAALQAPFVIGSHEVARAALRGPAGRMLREELEGAGLAPLALIPAQLRRLISTRALVAPDRFRGVRLRVVDNATSAAGLEALGAKPKLGLASDEVFDELQAGRLDGAETAPEFILDNGYEQAARHLTGFALFDRVDTFVASPRALAGLTAPEQEALRAAAADTVRFAATLAAREASAVGKLCVRGVSVDVPTASGLRALSAATAPVRDALTRDPATAGVLRALTSTPGAGPVALAPPRSCTAPRPQAAADDARATFPEGTYDVTVTPADYRRFGEYGDESRHDRTHSHVFEDGRITYTVSPEWGPQADRCPCYGDYRFERGELVIDWDRPDFGIDRVRWSYLDGRLTFTDAVVDGANVEAVYLAHPWRKVR